MNDVRATELLALAEEAATYMRGADATLGRERLDADHAECEVALRWFVDQGRPDEALRMCLALLDYWQYTDRITSARRWFDEVLSARPTLDRRRAEAMFSAGMLAFWQGEDAEARAQFTAGLELARDLGAPTETAIALTGLARLALRDDVEQGAELAREALETVKDVDEVRGRANATHVLGVAAQMAGRHAEARTWMTQRLTYARDMNDLRMIASEAANLSYVELALGDTPRARALATEALTTADRLGDEWMIPYCVNALAAIAVVAQQHQRAAVLLGAAEQMVVEQGATWPPDEAEHFARSRAAVTAALGTQEAARSCSLGQSWSTERVIAFALMHDAEMSS